MFIKKKLILFISILFLLLFVMTGCNGGETVSEEIIRSTSVNLEVKDSNGDEIPFLNLSLQGEEKNHVKKTSIDGLTSFSSLRFAENKEYVVEPKELFINSNLTVVDDFITLNFNGDLLNFDDFSDSSSGWDTDPVNDNDLYRVEYINNKYELEVKQNSYTRTIYPPKSQ